MHNKKNTELHKKGQTLTCKSAKLEDQEYDDAKDAMEDDWNKSRRSSGFGFAIESPRHLLY